MYKDDNENRIEDRTKAVQEEKTEELQALPVSDENDENNASGSTQQNAYTDQQPAYRPYANPTSAMLGNSPDGQNDINRSGQNGSYGNNQNSSYRNEQSSNYGNVQNSSYRNEQSSSYGNGQTSSYGSGQSGNNGNGQSSSCGT